MYARSLVSLVVAAGLVASGNGAAITARSETGVDGLKFESRAANAAPQAVGLTDAAKVQSRAQAQRCRCGPNDSCWPSALEWYAFDTLLGKRLIKNHPIAESCYPGPQENRAECENITRMWPDQIFQETNPIGRVYPYNITCAPVNYAAGEQPTTCSLGISPVYAVNATSRLHITAALAYAQLKNIRVVVTSTGHDLLARSDGWGSLQIWLRYYRNAINFQQKFKSSSQCTKSGWTGSALDIDGAWQWVDVYKVAKANDVIVVGGGSVGPGAIGGWPSGGGHGPATRNYGLGADQILEAEVMLADGRIVVANHCQNTDLFRAMRGGGPGYGITLSAKVKAYPNVKAVTSHRLAIAPLEKTPENKALLDAVAVLLNSYPDINDGGFAGYAFWFRNFPGPFIGNATSGYSHGIWTIGKKRCAAERVWAPVREALEQFKDKLFISETWAEYPDYWSFYAAESGVYDPAGDTSVLTSRLIPRESVTDKVKLRQSVEELSGGPDEIASNVVLLVSGGKVFDDATDPTSGLHPGWRKSHFALITGRGLPRTASQEVRKAITDDITFVKGAAGKRLAPTTGGYMNEGDRHDPDYINTFYGSNYASHLAAKRKYDPFNVFYCPSCVGSEVFVERPDGPLCWK